MAKARSFKTGWVLRGAAAAALGLTIPGSVFGQKADDKGWDLLDQMRRTESVALQKLDSVVRTALAEADKLAVADPDKAVARILTALSAVEEDNVSPKERREAALKQLKNRLNTLQSAVADTGSKAEERDRKAKAVARQAADRDRYAQEVEDIRARLAGISKLQEGGNYSGAAKEATDFAKQYPGTSVGRAADQSAEAADKAAMLRKGQNEKNQGLFNGFHDVSKSLILPKGDVDFPSDWAEKTQRRASTNQLTSKERAIMKALGDNVSVSFKNTRLEAALEQLRVKSGQSILLDPEALKEVDATYDSPVTLDAKAVSLRTALKKILSEVGLTYIIKDETIYVTSLARARETMVVKRYYIGDLLASMGGTSLPANTGLPIAVGPQVKAFITPQGIPGMVFGQSNAVIPPQTVNQIDMLQNQAQTIENAKIIVDMIKNSVDPNSWTTSGGAGTISFHAGSMSIIIKQTAEMHALLGSGPDQITNENLLPRAQRVSGAHHLSRCADPNLRPATRS